MTKWVVAVSAVALACTGEPLTNFGPPGGLSGKVLPPGELVPGGDAGGKTDARMMMKKCVFKAPAEGGTMDTGGGGPVDEAGAEGSVAEAGTVAEAGGGTDAGATEGGSSGSTCSVSWSRDIFKNMTAAGPWQCASAACHGGGGVAGPVLSDDPTASYDALVAYTTKLTTPSLPYILPCSTDSSKSAFLCNTSGTSCGPQMPLTTNGAALLTPKQVAMIETWISCGAIDN